MLADFAKECKEKKKRAFSSYRSLEEVLEKYGIKSSSITSIPQFTPVPHPIDEKSPEFKLCIDDILRKQNQPGKGVAQNLMQCRSSCEMNLDTLKKKRTADEAFEEYEYVYGIVTTATDWLFRKDPLK
ncbi:unnamed protein product [Rhizophagus irregularis]|nr:unnamed protein product [Rhizophagus irregularis]